jgi:hypothetical protein
METVERIPLDTRTFVLYNLLETMVVLSSNLIDNHDEFPEH